MRDVDFEKYIELGRQDIAREEARTEQEKATEHSLREKELVRQKLEQVALEKAKNVAELLRNRSIPPSHRGLIFRPEYYSEIDKARRRGGGPMGSSGFFEGFHARRRENKLAAIYNSMQQINLWYTETHGDIETFDDYGARSRNYPAIFLSEAGEIFLTAYTQKRAREYAPVIKTYEGVGERVALREPEVELVNPEQVLRGLGKLMAKHSIH